MIKRVSPTTYALARRTSVPDEVVEALGAALDTALGRVRKQLLERLVGAGRKPINPAQARIGGRRWSAARLVKQVADSAALMEVALEQLEEAGLLGAAGPATALTEAEEAALARGAFTHPATAGAAPTVGAPAPHSRGKAEFARLVSDACSTEQAAKALGVNNSRIRQRLTETPRTLYGIKLGREWRIPKFQFAGRGMVPGLDQVVAKLPGDIHPVTFYRWLTTPTPDLTLDEHETPVAPLDWLKLGHAPERVAELAANL